MKVSRTPISLKKILNNVAFLDIETTGLSKTKNNIFCIGILSHQESNWEALQYLCKPDNEEKALLEAFLNNIKNFPVLCTFGGNNFDLSFIKEKLNAYGLDKSILDSKTLLDLKKIPFITGILKTMGITRKQLEEHLGYKRTCSIEGKSILKTYTLWENTSDSIYEQVLLNHNLEELVSLVYLYDLYCFTLQLSSLKAPSYEFAPDSLAFNIIMKDNFISSFYFQKDDFILNWNIETCIATVRIECPKRDLKRYLIPAKDYFFIPSENQIIHKSIAQFIPPAFKQKLTKEQCTLSTNNYFIKCYGTKYEDNCIWYDLTKNKYLPYDYLAIEETPYFPQVMKSFFHYLLKGFKQ